MKSEWYYSDAGTRVGPLSSENIASRIRHSANETQLVWTAGMVTWEDAREVPAFSALFTPAEAPPPLPERRNSRPQNSGAASTRPAGITGEAADKQRDVSSLNRPWRRYFARSFDLWIFVLAAAVAAGMMFPTLFAGTTNANDQLLGLLFIAAYIPVEGFCLYAFGTTLGKALYGINLTYTHSAPGWIDATKRSAMVWFRGLG
jgi:hypothetical protein